MQREGLGASDGDPRGAGRVRIRGWGSDPDKDGQLTGLEAYPSAPVVSRGVWWYLSVLITMHFQISFQAHDGVELPCSLMVCMATGHALANEI